MRIFRSGYVVGTFIILGLASNSNCQPPPGNTVAAWIERGNAELNRSFFSVAEADFRKAVELQPNNAQAYTLLARALLGQLLPNLRLFPDTEGLLPKAEEAATRAVELAPTDPNALCVAGIVNYKIATVSKDPREKARRLNQANDAFQRALGAHPNSVEAHYELARMIADLAAEAVMQARFQSGMKMGQGGPIVNGDIRHLMQKRYGAFIEQAIAHATHALEVDPLFSPAMGELAGLLTTRACLRDSDTEHAADTEAARSWKAKEAALIASRPRPSTPINPAIGAILGSIPSAAPPPPERNPPKQP